MGPVSASDQSVLQPQPYAQTPFRVATPYQAPPPGPPALSPDALRTTMAGLYQDWQQNYLPKFPAETPDAAYQAYGDQYYDQHIGPLLRANGYPEEAGRDQWRQSIIRPESSEHPRLKSIGAGLLSGITMHLSPTVEQFEAEAQKSAQLAQISPLYGMLGQGLSEIPAWELGFAGVGRLAEALKAGRLGKGAIATAVGQSPVLPAALRAAAGALVQGPLDAVKTENRDHPIQSGLGGAAMGAAGTLGIEGLLNASRISRYLRQPASKGADLADHLANTLGLGRTEAEAVSKAALGGPADNTATFTIMSQPEVEGAIRDWAQKQAAASKSAGVASSMTTDIQGMPHDRLNVTMTGADGQVYNLGGPRGLLPKDFDIQRIAEHLDAGGSIGPVQGQPSSVQEFYNRLEAARPNKFKFDWPLRAAEDTPQGPAGAGHIYDNDTIPIPTGTGGYYAEGITRPEPGLAEAQARAQTTRAMGGYLETAGTLGPEGVSPGGSQVYPSDVTPTGTGDYYQRGITRPEPGARSAYEQSVEAEAAARRTQAAARRASLEAQTRAQAEAQVRQAMGGYLETAGTRGPAPVWEQRVNQLLSDIREARAETPEIPGAAPEDVVESKLNQLRETIQEHTQEQVPSNEEILRKIDILESEIGSTANLSKGQLIRGVRTPESAAVEAQAAAHESDVDTMLRQSLAARKVPIPDEPPLAPEVGRAPVEVEDIPPGDLPRGEVERTPVEGAPERARGSWDLPLNNEGRDQVDELGRDMAAKGGYDHVVTGDLSRTLETGQALLRHSPGATFEGSTADLQSWRGMEGETAEFAKPVKSSLAREAPNIRLPSTQHSTMPGESYNEFSQRAAGAVDQLLDAVDANPDKKIAAVTHGSVINNTRARGMNATNGRLSEAAPDVETFLKEDESPADVVRVERNPNGTVTTRDVDPKSPEPVKPGLDLIRHGQTDANRPTSARVKDNPLYRQVLAQESLGEGKLAKTVPGAPGEKPTITYGPEAFRDPTTRISVMTHEAVHAHSAALNMGAKIRDAIDAASEKIGDSGFVNQVFENGFSNAAKKVYSQTPHLKNEEMFATIGGAVRSNNQELLERLGQADTDKDHLLNWFSEASDQIRARLAMEPDGNALHKATFERRLDSFIARSSRMIDDVNRSFDNAPGEVTFENGHYVFRQTGGAAAGSTFRFGSRDSLAQFMERNYPKPLTAPELVDTGALEDFTPRYAMETEAPNVEKPGVDTVPPPKDKAGFLGLSYFTRGDLAWHDSVARTYEAPELYEAAARLSQATVKFDNGMDEFSDLLRDTVYKHDMKRQKDFYAYFRADDATKPNVYQEARFTPTELEDLEKVRLGMAKLGYLEPFEKYLRNDVRNAEDAGFDLYKMGQAGAIHDDLNRDAIERGLLDPKDRNFIKVSAGFVRRRLQAEHLDDALSDYQKVAYTKEVGPDGKERFKFGALVPLMQRNVDFLRGVPDWSQKAIYSAIEGAVGMINRGIDAVNPHLPEALQLTHWDVNAKDALRRFIMFNYASHLGLRPSIAVRDAMQFWLTTFPVLGAEYSVKGMNAAFRERSTWAAQAREAGALISRRNLLEMAGEEAPDLEGQSGSLKGRIVGTLEKGSEKMLSVISLAHNSNRLAAFAGHTMKIEDAFDALLEHQDLDRFLKESDGWFLNESARNIYRREAQGLLRASAQQGEEATSQAIAQTSRRMAKDLVDGTQWNIRRGAAPGMYKYAIGRLFGQYGTFPLNYIEYARRLTGYGHPFQSPAIQAMLRLALAHGAILAGGAAMGIDTSKWVFTNPMAWGGGPLLQAVTDVPQAMDFQTPRGAEARRDLWNTIGLPGIVPGMDEFHEFHSFLTSPSGPHPIIRGLGFTPLKDTQKDAGYYKFVPTF